MIGNRFKRILFKKIIIFILLSIISPVVDAREGHEYSVMSAYGKVEVLKSNDGSNWELVKVGAGLSNSNIINITDGYLCLLHKSGSTVEITKHGKIKVSMIKRLISKNKSDIKTRISRYVFAKITEKKVGNDNEGYGTNPVGGVEREVILTDENKTALIVLYPKNSKIIDSVVPFCWTGLGSTDFEFIIRDKFDKMVYNQQCIDSIIYVNLFDLNLTPGQCYYWNVKSANRESKQYCILPVYDKEIRDIKSEAGRLIMALNPHSPIDNVILGAYYADKKIAYKAAEHYRKAVMLAPSSDEYRIILRNYIYSVSDD